MRSQLFFSWLAVASVVAAQITKFTDGAAVQDELPDEDGIFDDQEIDTSLDGYEHESVARDLAENRKAKRAPLAIRDALADEAINMIHEYGQGVDISLEGYDHDAVVRDVEEGPLENAEQGLGFEGAKRLARMKPHYVQHKERDEEEDAESDEDVDEGGDEEDEGPWVDLDSDGEGDVAERDVDEDYDEEGDGLDDDGDTPLVSLERDADKRDADEDYEEDGVDLEDDGDTPLVSLERDVENGEADSPDDIDYSLEGYDHLLRDRDSDYYDPDEAFHDGAYDTVDTELGSEEQDLDDEERVIQKGPPTRRRRDLADEDLYEEEDEEDGAFANAWATVRRWIDDVMN